MGGMENSNFCILSMLAFGQLANEIGRDQFFERQRQMFTEIVIQDVSMNEIEDQIARTRQFGEHISIDPVQNFGFKLLEVFVKYSV